ncbi:MAG: anti-sigma factor family protein [Chloroflexota bacterium]
MHKHWQEEIPFYVAESLDSASARALEDHLAQCKHCRQYLAEWQLIAEAVHMQGSEWSRGLPPLAQHVRETIRERQEDIIVHISDRPRGWRLLAAAAFVVIIALLVFLILSDFGEVPDVPSTEETSIARLATRVPQTPLSILPLETSQGVRDDVGILSTPTSSFTSTVLPTRPAATIQPRQPTQSSPEMFLSPVLPIMPQGEVAAALMFPDSACTAGPRGMEPVIIYSTVQESRLESGILYAQDRLRVLRRSASDQLQLEAPGGGVAGWVDAEDVALDGDCDQVPTASATDVSNPVISHFELDRVIVQPGESVTLSWHMNGETAVQVSAYRYDVQQEQPDDQPLQTYVGLPAIGSLSFVIPMDFDGEALVFSLSFDKEGNDLRLWQILTVTSAD